MEYLFLSFAGVRPTECFGRILVFVIEVSGATMDSSIVKSFKSLTELCQVPFEKDKRLLEFTLTVLLRRHYDQLPDAMNVVLHRPGGWQRDVLMQRLLPSVRD